MKYLAIINVFLEKLSYTYTLTILATFDSYGRFMYCSSLSCLFLLWPNLYEISISSFSTPCPLKVGWLRGHFDKLCEETHFLWQMNPIFSIYTGPCSVIIIRVMAYRNTTMKQVIFKFYSNVLIFKKIISTSLPKKSWRFMISLHQSPTFFRKWHFRYGLTVLVYLIAINLLRNINC